MRLGAQSALDGGPRGLGFDTRPGLDGRAGDKPRETITGVSAVALLCSEAFRADDLAGVVSAGVGAAATRSRELGT